MGRFEALKAPLRLVARAPLAVRQRNLSEILEDLARALRLQVPSPHCDLTELSAVLKCSTVMVTTTVCSSTASSSRTPSLGPEPVMTTAPPSRTRPTSRPRALTSTSETMAEREESSTFTLPAAGGRRRRRARTTRAALPSEFLLETLLFHSYAGKTLIDRVDCGSSVSARRICPHGENMLYLTRPRAGTHGPAGAFKSLLRTLNKLKSDINPQCERLQVE